MNILILLIPCSLFLGGLALTLFIWTLRNGQYDDLQGDPERSLLDHDAP